MNKFNVEIDGKKIEFEIRNLAEQANGSCLVRCGDTLVLAAAVMSSRETNLDYFPLTVEYRERYYAAGRIGGSRYIRREGRPSDEAIITARLIDRAIRPRFPRDLKREIQVIITCLSWDGENDPDILGLLGASLSLSLSDIPWSGPIGTVRIGSLNSDFILNPNYKEREKTKLDFLVSGVDPIRDYKNEGKLQKGQASNEARENNKVLMNMIEAHAQEVSESDVLKSWKKAETEIKKLIDFQKDIVKKLGKEKILIPENVQKKEIEKQVKEVLAKKLENALYKKSKIERNQGKEQIKQNLIKSIEENYSDPDKIKIALDFFEQEIDKIIHENILKNEKRQDGRRLDEIRELKMESGLLPRTHGSGLFCRGTTKSLSILTLGGPGDQQILEGMEVVGKKRFMHHYNFPPYSVGETRPLRGPGRREIGHGMLAEKALLPLLPNVDEFPYTIRIVSEILSSNGSSSMASVSSSSLALMDAGVPIKNPASGIAIGLMAEEKGNYRLLADIQGPEDSHGDMDLKVAGTKDGITAIQMDVKFDGINDKIFKEALEMAKKCRVQILGEMEKVLAKPRPELSPYAPRIITVQIDPKKIGKVIGPGGKMINQIVEECEVTIDIEDTGEVFITSESPEGAEKAVNWVKNLTREVKIGEIFEGKVKRVLDFGAFIELIPNQEGLLHVSKMGSLNKKDRGSFIKKAGDVISVGQTINVQIISIDEQGRIDLSLRK